ncbi:DUF3083 family protein [Aliidiomarina soli]|uniref:DUF3083 domain-containing protein n=1 Tax=Aliidiomarina soli TaxID=1928574 RepID=A0A432WI52_9GAMM|nr:DUF3083 family protein [Aliidiomarina soli]RUO33359.1 hypothetical protein CWE14_09105 [Aliidiomarina soli]
MSTAHRAYIPTNAHSNQYVLVELKPSDEFYQTFKSPEACYDKLSRLFFRLAEDESLSNVHFIANDKLPVVRYHSEYYCFQTQKQMLFFYNPKYHEAQNAFIKPDYKARKIRLLFLATGSDIRANSAQFHRRVHRLIKHFKAELPDLPLELKVRDHQHLSYDLFARDKGHKETYAYKLRSLYARYEKRNCDLPQPRSELTYATVALPLSRRLKQNLKLHDHDYGAMYKRIETVFTDVCEKHGIAHRAFVANGKTPLVRNSQVDISEQNSELQKMSFDTTSDDAQQLSFYEDDNLVEAVNFIFVAGQHDCHERGYGRFMNRVHEALKDLTGDIKLRPEHDDLIVRFYQHISYIL